MLLVYRAALLLIHSTTLLLCDIIALLQVIHQSCHILGFAHLESFIQHTNLVVLKKYLPTSLRILGV